MKTTSAQSFLFQALPLGILDLPTQAESYWAVWEREKLCVTMNTAASMQTIYLANKVYRVETYQSFVREISHDYWPWLRDLIQSAWGMTTQS